MVKFKRFMAKALAAVMLCGLTAVAAPTAPAVSVYAAEAKVNQNITIAVDYESYTAKIVTQNEGENYLFLEVLKKKGEDYKVSATYTYQVGEVLVGESRAKGVVVDLSFLKATSEQYIRAYGSKNMSGEAMYTGITKVAAQPAKLKLKFVEGKGTVAESFNHNGKALTESDVMKYSFRTQYGSVWEGLENFHLANEIVAGTSILVREDANGAAPAGAEVKVKVKAIGKAPKVTIDYVKEAIPVKKDMQYRVITADIDDAANWVTVSAAAKLSPTAIVTEYLKVLKDTETKAADVVAAGFTFVARTAKTGKAPTAAAFVSVPAQATIAQSKDGSKVLNEIKVSDSSKLTWTIEKEGVKFVATSPDFAYSLDEGKTWKTIKASSSGVVVKLESKDATDILLRTVGAKATDKAEAKFPSASLKITIAAKTAAATPTVENGTVTDANKNTVTVARTEKTADTIKLTTTATVFEYSLDKEEWTALTGDGATITNAEKVTVYIRVAETNDALASEAVGVEIAAKEEVAE